MIAGQQDILSDYHAIYAGNMGLDQKGKVYVDRASDGQMSGEMACQRRIALHSDMYSVSWRKMNIV